MEMLRPEAELIPHREMRALKRVEYERLAAEGFFDHERVELVFGVVVPMSPTKPPHANSTAVIFAYVLRAVGSRAHVRSQSSFAASEDSLPEPDIFVVPNDDYWTKLPARVSRHRGRRHVASLRPGGEVEALRAGRCRRVLDRRRPVRHGPGVPRSRRRTLDHGHDASPRRDDLDAAAPRRHDRRRRRRPARRVRRVISRLRRVPGLRGTTAPACRRRSR